MGKDQRSERGGGDVVGAPDGARAPGRATRTMRLAGGGRVGDSTLPDPLPPWTGPTLDAASEDPFAAHRLGPTNAFLKTWRDQDNSRYPQQTRDLLWGSADRAIRANMTPDDLSAVIRERRGETIARADGTPFDHIEEFRGARNAILNTLEAIRRRLKQLDGDSTTDMEVETIERKRRDLSVLVDVYENIAGGSP